MVLCKFECFQASKVARERIVSVVEKVVLAYPRLKETIEVGLTLVAWQLFPS
jgi:hypothetical protein